MRGAPALDGLKVVEFGHIIAGPLAGVLRADLGAEVIHVEDPGEGDPHRSAGPAMDGTHLWWKVAARNKRSVTLNLRTEEGRRPARDEPGFGKVAEAMSGVVDLTGFPDGPPVHTGFSHGDSVGGPHGCVRRPGRALPQGARPRVRRGSDRPRPRRRAVPPDRVAGRRAGPARRGRHPRGQPARRGPAAVINVYRTGDDRWLTVTSGTPRAVRKVAALLGERAEDYATREQQHERRDRLDALLAEWVGERTVEECLGAMVELAARPVPKA
ncbi:CoA transferase [Pseudonocardia sp. RS010]|uniref:CoA transferase n=1 Tax=Pseudonocardia sp. RS010 TaxID=3385979 RepID=UPI0039A39E98